jgi:hypothetical protein
MRIKVTYVQNVSYTSQQQHVGIERGLLIFFH